MDTPPHYVSGSIDPLAHTTNSVLGGNSVGLPHFFALRAIFLNDASLALLKQLLSSIRSLHPQISIIWNHSGMWCRVLNNNLASEFLLSVFDCFSTFYLRDRSCVVHVLTHDLDAALSDISTRSTCALEILDDPGQGAKFQVRTLSDANTESTAAVPLLPTPGKASAHLTGALWPERCVINLANPPARTSTTTKELSKVLKGHRAKMLEVALTPYGGLRVCSEYAGNPRETNLPGSKMLTYPDLCTPEAQYVHACLTSSVRSLGLFENVTICQQDETCLALAAMFGQVSYVRHYLLASSESFVVNVRS